MTSRLTSFEILNFDPSEVPDLLSDEKNVLLDLSRLAFGTAGLRAPMGIGYGRMNSLVVLQTTQGLCEYLKLKFPGQKLSVVIGYDGRRNSEKFAHVAAAVFIASNFHVHLFSKYSPTPLTPFLVKSLGLAAGVQVTASHNPKDDNGYKLFGHLGAQICPPIDTEISSFISQNLVPHPKALELLDPQTLLLKNRAACFDPLETAQAQYLTMIKNSLCREPLNCHDTALKFVYTAMHGVGWELLSRLWEEFKFPASSLIPVPEQKDPDPEFPTVSFPNPEEKGALNRSISLANAIKADYVLANDPDADRFTAAERNKDNEWMFFTGDQIGVLFADWQCQHHTTSSNGLLLTSIVSSRMLEAFARARGLKYIDTLTGFKYMATASVEARRRDPSLTHLLAYEEAIGYQLTDLVPDKDGMSAACVWAEMAQAYRKRGFLVSDRLKQLQKEIGLFLTNNGYYICKDPNLTRLIFDEFRTNNYQVNGFHISQIRDITKGKGSDLPATPDSQMIQFKMGSVFTTLRASGTEPKIKYYTEASAENETEARLLLDQAVNALNDHFFKPDKYGLSH